MILGTAHRCVKTTNYYKKQFTYGKSIYEGVFNLDTIQDFLIALHIQT